MEAAESQRILIVDDDEVVLALLEHLLVEAGHRNVVSTPDPAEVEALYATLRPDLVLVDLDLPHVPGMEVLRWLMQWSAGECLLPVVVMSGDTTMQTKREAFAAGARDFLAKPFEPLEAVRRLENLLELRRLSRALEAVRGGGVGLGE